MSVLIPRHDGYTREQLCVSCGQRMAFTHFVRFVCICTKVLSSSCASLSMYFLKVRREGSLSSEGRMSIVFFQLLSTNEWDKRKGQRKKNTIPILSTPPIYLLLPPFFFSMKLFKNTKTLLCVDWNGTAELSVADGRTTVERHSRSLSPSNHVWT